MIKIITLNICALPRIFNPLGNPLNRIGDIINYIINKDADIVCLQEVFCSKVIKILEKNLSNMYKIFYDKKKIYFKLTSGLMILSKFNVTNFKFEKFTNSYREDSLANKGIMLITIKINNVNYTVFNTHFNATVIFGSKKQSNIIKEKQLEQLSKLLNTFSNQNLIVCGDFNFDINNYLNQNYRIYTKDIETYKNKKYDFVFCNLLNNNINYKYNVEKNLLSDHYPVFFKLIL